MSNSIVGIYPAFDDCPISYFCQNLLQVIYNHQIHWLRWQNAKWSNIFKSTLRVLDEKQLIVGQPVTSNARGLYCFGLGNQLQPTTDDRLTASLILCYTSGNVQLNGTSANRYGDVLEASFYLHAFNSLIKRLQDSNQISDELTYNWPTTNNFYNNLGEIVATSISEPPEVIVTTSNLNPDSQIAKNLDSLGVEASLQVELVISPSIIKLPY